jgi:hypothetical protein
VLFFSDEKSPKILGNTPGSADDGKGPGSAGGIKFSLALLSLRQNRRRGFPSEEERLYSNWDNCASPFELKNYSVKVWRRYLGAL